jgi:predicted glycosyltransferase
MWEELQRRGWSIAIASREKDVTTQLLDDLGVDHLPISKMSGGRLGLGAELMERDRALLRLARGDRPQVILTRSPSGTHVGRLLGVPSVFDTDNGLSAGAHYRAAAPFASVITTPDCFAADLGPKQVRYTSYKALAFLHPNRFQPDPGIRRQLGMADEDKYFLIRLVAMRASHDHHESGFPLDHLDRVVSLLEDHGRVLISSEGPLPDRFTEFGLRTSAGEFHSVLAGASLCIGDSGSVAQEAAILGVPSIFVSSFAGRTAPLEEMEHRYGLVSSFPPHAIERAIGAIADSFATEPDTHRRRHRRMLEEKVDLTSWYVDLVETVATGDVRPRSGLRMTP